MPKIPTATAPKSTPLTPRVATLDERIRHFDELMALIIDVPAEWLKSTPNSSESGGESSSSNGNLSCTYCDSYATLVSAWRKALKWTDGLDNALVCMLSSSMSTNLVGEQLWFKILGPPSCGKTTILEGLSLNTEYVFSKDSIRGFYSGWKDDSGDDVSIAAKVRGKTLATKDGDTLLKAPNLSQILSEARGLYDRRGRTNFRNGQDFDYIGHRMTWILCGTSALREIDDSELGARFIDCVVMDEIDDEFEDDVAMRAAYSEANAMMVEATGDVSTQETPELTLAMQLTGGYVGYLRRNAADLISQVTASDEVLKECARLGKFIAFMRARPPKKKEEEDADREFSPRLVKQVVRLAQSMAVVTNKKSVDAEVMARVRKVAFDTSRGLTLDITRRLSRWANGLDKTAIEKFTNQTPDRIGIMLRFLRKIGVVELNKAPSTKTGAKMNQSNYILTDKIRKLYHAVTRDVE